MAKKKHEEDKYYPPITYYSDKAIVTVHHPILTDEERARQMERVKKAATGVLNDMYAKGTLPQQRNMKRD